MDPALLDCLMSYPEAEPARQQNAVQWLEMKLADDETKMLAIVENDLGCVGYVQITGLHRKGSYAWFGIAILPSAHGLGVGRKAMQRLFEYAANELKLRKILCEVRQDNIAAVSLYRSLGFSTVGTLANHYQDLGKNWHDVLIMERFLA